MKSSKVAPVASALITLAVTGTTHAEDAPVKSLGVITVNSGQPTSLPTHIPTTTEGITRETIEATINATDSEDAIKYFPSLLVRKRYVGDYNHAVLSSRASGTGNSARSAVYADGILISNFLGNGATFAPRWGLVTPEEIERVDVMYGPFSAAYPGNSVGAVVDYVTRMPEKLEAHAKVSVFRQPYDLYGTRDTFGGTQASASLGNRVGDWSWWVNANRTDSRGQPLSFATKAMSKTSGAGTTPVTGAIADQDKSNVGWWILGTTGEYHTVQDHTKIKLAYDITPTMRLAYTLGMWDNTSENQPKTFLRDAAGNPVYSGDIKINGGNYSLKAAPQFTSTNPLDFPMTKEKFMHYMHGISLKTNTRDTWDWEIAASLYDFDKDQVRASNTVLPGAAVGGAGTLTNQKGTGWTNISFRGTWRPQGIKGEHIVDFGYQQENYTLRSLKSDIAGNWLVDGPGAVNTDVGGKTQLRSAYLQDTWGFAPNWKTVLGLRLENWKAWSGYAYGKDVPAGPKRVDYEGRNETFVSPKAAIAYQMTPATVIKASLGRAVRMPTVSELYGNVPNSGTSTILLVNDPKLRPEKSWTSELSMENDLGNGILRTTLFFESVTDSLYSEKIVSGNVTTTRVTNVGEIRTPGAEVAYQGNDVLMNGLDLSGSLTYANSLIVKNDGYVVVPGDTLGKYQPRVPVWRATAVATYRFDEKLSSTLAWRYSGAQYSTLDNSDYNGFTYQGFSAFKVVDLRVRYKINKQWSAAFGVDNLTNYQYWAFHPYPQRSYSAELKFDL